MLTWHLLKRAAASANATKLRQNVLDNFYVFITRTKTAGCRLKLGFPCL
jgi:hypothetical protein